jgi:hypothetical protein
MFQETAASAKGGDAVFRSAAANRSHSKFRAKTCHLSARAERTAETPLLSRVVCRMGWKMKHSRHFLSKGRQIFEIGISNP